MKRLILIFVALMTFQLQAVELQTIKHKVIHDKLAYQLEIADHRYCIWTDDQEKSIKMLKDFGVVVPDFQLREGEIFAIFLNDNIMQNLIQIVYNKTADQTFADYADSGIRKKFEAPDVGKKYTHVTAVVFTPIKELSHLGMRDIVHVGLSEKQ